MTKNEAYEIMKKFEAGEIQIEALETLIGRKYPDPEDPDDCFQRENMAYCSVCECFTHSCIGDEQFICSECMEEYELDDMEIEIVFNDTPTKWFVVTFVDDSVMYLGHYTIEDARYEASLREGYCYDDEGNTGISSIVELDSRPVGHPYSLFIDDWNTCGRFIDGFSISYSISERSVDFATYISHGRLYEDDKLIVEFYEHSIEGGFFTNGEVADPDAYSRFLSYSKEPDTTDDEGTLFDKSIRLVLYGDRVY